MAHSNYRAMPICMGMGEAAGVAVALSIKNHKKVREIEAKDIQEVIGGLN